MSGKIGYAAVLLIAIISIAVATYFLMPETKAESFDIDMFEVDNGNDNGRSFTVEESDIGYGNELGAWALLQLSPSYSFGVKFNNITIPKNATIKNVYIELYSIGTPKHDRPNCRIYCDKNDSIANFSEMGVLDICGRIYTNNSVRWNATAPYGEWVKTPSLKQPFEEILNGANWTSGNSIAFLFVSQGYIGYSASFRNYESGSSPRLYIEWKSND